MEKILSLRAQMSAMSGTTHVTTIGKKYFEPTGTKFKVFQDQPEDYVGKYEDEVISQKEKQKDLPRRYYDYYPQDYYNKNKEFRKIPSSADARGSPKE
jgi:hypothetical protein